MSQIKDNATASTSSGVGFTGLLTIVFIVLKLTHVIPWSWFWVLSPILFSTALFLLLFIILLFAVVVFSFGSR